MTQSNAKQLRELLATLGLSDQAIAAAWPRWWSDEADLSPSARAELRFSVARRLGLDPRSLSGQDTPTFVWREEARFKHLSGEDDVQRAGITSFGRSVASALLRAAPEPMVAIGDDPAAVRTQLLSGAGRPFVDLGDLVNLSWMLGIPVVHLRVFPWPQKRMAAMAVSVGERYAILLGKDSMYPAPSAFYVAHELAHIALGHLDRDQLIVDLADDTPSLAADDEEIAADEFALQLLTGNKRPTVLADDTLASPNATRVAHAAMSSSAELGIEPGVLAMCFGYSSGDWKSAMGALKAIYPNEQPVWTYVNKIAQAQLEWDDVSDDAADFLADVLGDDQAS